MTYSSSPPLTPSPLACQRFTSHGSNSQYDLSPSGPWDYRGQNRPFTADLVSFLAKRLAPLSKFRIAAHMAGELAIVYHKVRQITITIAITYLNNFGSLIL